MTQASQDLKLLKDLKHINLNGLRFRLVDAKGQVRALGCLPHPT